MKTAIICYSFTHNNLALAEELVSRNGGTLIKIEEKKKRTRFTILIDTLFNRLPTVEVHPSFDEKFDHCILLSPIWAGQIASPLRSFLLKEGKKIRSYSFISICGGGSRQQQQLDAELTTLLHLAPVKVAQLSLADLAKGHTESLMDYQVDGYDIQHYNKSIEDFLSAISNAFAPAVPA